MYKFYPLTIRTMTKVIENLGLLRKLEPYLEYRENEYICCIDWEDNWQYSWHTTRIVKSNIENIEIYDWWDKCQSGTDFYKTLTLEEAMDLLPIYTHMRQIRGWEWLTDNKAIWIKDKNIWGKTKLQAIEKMLHYLIDNNLLEND